MKLSDFSYRAARTSRDVEAAEKRLSSGNPEYLECRLRNRLVGHGLSPVWRRLSGPWFK